jgi:hypothetical protein
MSVRNRIGTAVASAVLLVTLLAGLPAPALAQSHGGHHGPVVVGRGFGYGFGYGYGPYFGLGWGPYWGPWGYGPYAYGPEGGIDLNVAMMSGYGGVDMDVKPNQAEVWVDGKFIAEAKELDGYPSYLWLKEGVHRIVVYKGGYQRFEEEIEVLRGFKKDLRVHLEKGESEAPGRRPAGQI